MKISIWSAAFLLACTTFAHAQHTIYRGKEAAALCAGSKTVHIAKKSNSTTFKTPTLVDYGEHSTLPFAKVESILTSVLGIRDMEKLVLYRTETDKLGFNNYRYQQYYKGIEVEHGQYLVHEKNGTIRSMNGLWLEHIHVSTSPTITEAQALQAALNYTKASLYKWEIPSEEAFLKTHTNNPQATYFPKGTLKIIAKDFDYKNPVFHLCYQFDVFAAEPVSRNAIYIDAHTGLVIATENKIHGVDVPATATTYYSGTKNITCDMVSAGNYRLRESGRGLGLETYNMLNGTNYGAAVDFTNTTTTWNTVADKQAYDVHWGMESSYDYYLNVHGRNSADNAGVKLKSYVHYSTNLADAGHIPDQPIFYFGDGNIGAGFKPFTSLDICAHEFTHAVTTYSCHLLYASESSALHESFSDMFAMAVDFYTRPATANWQMADEVYVTAGNCIRNIANPNSKNHPDTYLGTYWYSGNNLNLISHTNSAVSSYWFYLMCQGGSGTNDIGSNYNVTGIGMTKGEQIAYRTLTVYMTSFANFADARMYSIQAAEDLYGVCSPEVATVTNAWYAVGVGAAYVATPDANFAANGVYSCSAPFTVNFSNYSFNTTNDVWYFGDGGTSSAIAPSHTYTNPGVYSVKLISSGACGTDSLLLNSYITVSTPAAPITFGDTSCSPTTFNLSASGNGTLDWYATSVGGASIQTGSNFTTPFLNSTTTYYVEDKIAGSIGTVGASTWAGLFGGNQAEFVTFDVLQACTLKSVTTQSYAAGTRNVTLRNKIGTILFDTLLNLPTGVVTINLNIPLMAGIGYELGGDTLNFAFDPTNTAYPYTLAGVASITGNTLNNYYLFFYNWTFETAPCISTRTPITAMVASQNTASISYPSTSICHSATATMPTLTGTGGAGTYLAMPTGLNINSTTGQIAPNMSTAGTYSVQYTSTGICPNTSTVSMTVVTDDAATISYPSATFCLSASNPSPTRLGTIGGTYSASPAGLSINAATGEINLASSSVGTYTVQYQTASNCPTIATTNVTISAVGNATFNYGNTSFCTNAGLINATITGIAGGTFSSSTGLSLDTNTGVIDFSTSSQGTYIVQYNVSGLCPASSNVTITVNSMDDASFSYPDGFYCVNSQPNAIATITGLIGGTFSSNPSGVVFANVNTGEIDFSAMQNLGAIYNIIYTTNGVCPDTSSDTIDLRNCGGVSNTINNTSIQVFPNPNNGQFEVRYIGIAGELWLDVVNSLGQTLHKQQQMVQAQDNYQVHLDNMPSGVYWLHFQQDKQHYTTRIVIRK